MKGTRKQTLMDEQQSEYTLTFKMSTALSQCFSRQQRMEFMTTLNDMCQTLDNVILEESEKSDAKAEASTSDSDQKGSANKDKEGGKK